MHLYKHVSLCFRMSRKFQIITMLNTFKIWEIISWFNIYLLCNYTEEKREHGILWCIKRCLQNIFAVNNLAFKNSKRELKFVLLFNNFYFDWILSFFSLFSCLLFHILGGNLTWLEQQYFNPLKLYPWGIINDGKAKRNRGSSNFTKLRTY